MKELGGLNFTHYCNKKYSLEMLTGSNLAWSISSMVAFLLTAIILVVVIFYRQYRTIVQHFFIYLTLFILVYLALASASIQLLPQFFQHTGEMACKWTGYLQSLVYISIFIISFELSAYLLYVMQFQVRGKPIPTLMTSKKVVLELVGLLLAVIIPAALLSIRLKNFGVYGATCWINIYKIDNHSINCSIDKDAIVLQTVIMSVSSVLYAANVVSYAILIVIFCLLACKYQQTRSHYKYTIIRTIILVSYLVLSGTVHLAFALCFYYISNDDYGLVNYPLLLVACILTPAIEFLHPLAFMFYLNSVKKFQWQVARSTAGEWKASWRLCCTQSKRWIRRKWGTKISINDTNDHLDEYLTPDLTTTSQYGTAMHSADITFSS